MGVCDCICACVPVLVIAIIAAGVAYFFASRNSGGGIQLPGLPNFGHQDQFNATTPEESPKWDTGFSNNGLQLMILNALDSDWYSFFDQAVADWDNGSPDVLTLSTSVVSPDSACQPLDGVMKVCNGDYGDNGWRGLNTAVITATGTITSSIAQMNEFYLSKESDARKQYTMCHEIGHGFGLGHVDENFDNKDLGTCMDYTNNPEANIRPNAANFEFLAAMYGVISGSTTSSAITAQDAVTQAEIVPGEQAKVSQPEIVPEEQYEPLPSWISDSWSSIMSPFYEPHSSMADNGDGWRLLHENEHVQVHEIDIGEGYIVRVNLFLANDEE